VFTDDGSLDRHYWQLCVLAELRTSLTSIANVQSVDVEAIYRNALHATVCGFAP